MKHFCWYKIIRKTLNFVEMFVWNPSTFGICTHIIFLFYNCDNPKADVAKLLEENKTQVVEQKHIITG